MTTIVFTKKGFYSDSQVSILDEDDVSVLYKEIKNKIIVKSNYKIAGAGLSDLCNKFKSRLFLIFFIIFKFNIVFLPKSNASYYHENLFMLQSYSNLLVFKIKIRKIFGPFYIGVFEEILRKNIDDMLDDEYYSIGSGNIFIEEYFNKNYFDLLEIIENVTPENQHIIKDCLYKNFDPIKAIEYAAIKDPYTNNIINHVEI